MVSRREHPPLRRTAQTIAKRGCCQGKATKATSTVTATARNTLTQITIKRREALGSIAALFGLFGIWLIWC